jgi:VWFA-related protein
MVLQTIRKALVTLAAVGFSPAQAPEAPIKVDVEVVNVFCTVHDHRGALVRDLKQDDFEILEDRRPQEIRYFTQESNLPLTVALLVDVSGSVHWFVEQEKGAVATFLQQVLRPDDRALLVGFSSTIILWQDLTPSTTLLGEALQRLRSVPFKGLPPLGFPMPSTLLYDAIEKTALGKLKSLSGRKVLIVISDGLDNGSTVHLDSVIQAVQATNTIVYGVCFESGFSGCSFLKEMSDPTGGRTFPVKKMRVDRIFQIIEEEMRSQYAIGYVSTNRAHDGTFRKLQVKVLPKGLRVAARKGYYAEKPQVPSP